MEVLIEKEFNVLVYLENCSDENLDADKAVRELKIDKEEFIKIFNKLCHNGYLKKTEEKIYVTDEGYEYLEPFKVKRAILLAAGFGSRMQPVTLETPKPLVEVNGTRIIETLLGALLEKKIDDITIVTGYLSDKFDVIRKKYPNIKFLYNERYSMENNISSAMLVRENYGNSYVMDADLYLKNKNLIRKYEYHSNYLGIKVKETDDWCLKTEGERVTAMVHGGKDTHLMVGLSYWSLNDGKTFSGDIEKLYDTEKGKQMYWDDVALTVFNENYDLHVRECDFDDIIEIDSIYELANIDPSYNRYIN